MSLSRSKKNYTITLDDDPLMHKIISRMTGLNSLPYSDPEKLLKRSSSYSPAAVFVDIHLDFGQCGLDFIPQLRQIWPFTPILVVTDTPNADYVGKALSLGANDYVRKPLVQEELMGRLQARISEMHAKIAQEELRVFDIIYNKNQRSITRDDQTVYLPNLESKLFQILAESQGMVISKDDIKNRLWGKISVSQNALDKKISSLRHLLKDIGAGFAIKSVYGGGVSLNSLPEAS